MGEHGRGAGARADGAVDVETRLEQLVGAFEVVLIMGEPCGPDVGRGEHIGIDRWRGTSEEVTEPAPSLGEVASALPERPERRAQPQAELDIGAARCPGQRRPDVVVLTLDAFEPLALFGAHHLARGGVGEREVEGGVAGGDGCPHLWQGVELLHGELAEQFVDLVAPGLGPVPGAEPVQKCLAHQRRQGGQRGAPDLGGGRAREPAAEHGQLPEGATFAVVEQPPRRVEHRAHAPLAFGDVPPFDRKEVEAPLDLGGDLPRAQGLAPGRGQLQPEGHPVDQFTDAEHVGHMIVVEREPGLHAPCRLHEQLHRRRDGRRSTTIRRVRKPAHDVVVLAMQVQPLARRHEEGEGRRRGEQVGDDVDTAGEQVLHVVEHEHQLLVPERAEQRVAGVAAVVGIAGVDRDADRRCDRRHHVVAARQWGEGDQEHAVGETIELATGELERQPCLSHAAHAGQREQPGPAVDLQRRQAGEVGLPTDERRQVGSQVRRRGDRTRLDGERRLGHERAVANALEQHRRLHARLHAEVVAEHPSTGLVLRQSRRAVTGEREGPHRALVGVLVPRVDGHESHGPPADLLVLVGSLVLLDERL